MVPNGRSGKLYIKEGVEVIYNRALACSLLQEVIFSGTVNTLKSAAFSGSKITKIDLNGRIEDIGIMAFNNCSNLQEVTIGENIKRIGDIAFYGSSNLKIVTIDHKTLLKSLTTQTSAGSLVNYATIYIKEGITEIGSYVVDNFDVVDTDKEGYVKYVKKTT